MSETNRSRIRRISNGDFEKYFQGHGIDIGTGPYEPVIRGCSTWDLENGDATYMYGMPDEGFDWVYSSHCLEHLIDPLIAIENWWRILKPGGHLIVVVPDWTLYEKKMWPSRYNSDHKHAFAMISARLRNPIPIHYVFSNLHNAQLLRIQVNDDGYNYDLEKRWIDQAACREIEVIVRKQKETFWSTL